MNEKWKQLLGSFMLGVMMPMLVLHFASLTRRASGVQPETTITVPTVSTQMPTQAPAALPVYLPVLTGNTVVTMELDTYLVGVLLGEMPAYFEEEALMAQAVVARTYTLYHQVRRDKHAGGAVCTDPGCCQAYVSETVYVERGGNEADVERIRESVKATTGLVLTHGGAYIDATYFSCSGGRTEDALAVWGEEIPYLQSVESPGENEAENYRHTVTFTAEEFQDLLGRNLSGWPGSWLGAVTYTKGGGVATMVLGGKTYTGTQLRQLLGLNSMAFTMRAEGDSIFVTTSGKGHRVGMSQEGAEAMAASGSTWQEILTHYYQGIRIDKLEDIR
jgi:stage II sporulation protein D